jgi:hypothetical protein
MKTQPVGDEYEAGQAAGREEAQAEIRKLHTELAELHADGGSSNDWTQVVDDWFTAHGYPTILYA